MTTLRWEDYGDIADALEEKYPQEDLVQIDDKRLIELVQSLEDFDDQPVPDDKDLISAVLYAWIGSDSPDEDATPSWA